MKRNLLVELNNHIATLGPHQRDRCGGQLLILAAHEIGVMRDTNRRLHERAQLVEAALPEWTEICAATKGQATGRFYPALVRLALTDAEKANTKLEADLGIERDLRKLFLQVIVRVAGALGIEHITEITGQPPWMEMLERIDAMKNEMAAMLLKIKVLTAVREIESTIGTIPGTRNLGPGLEPEKPLPKLPLRYRVVDGEEKDVAFIEDADGRMLFVIQMEGIRGRSTLDDLGAEAERRIAQLTRSIEEKAAR